MTETKKKRGRPVGGSRLLKVACPTCAAAVNVGCVTAAGLPLSAGHAARRELAGLPPRRNATLPPMLDVEVLLGDLAGVLDTLKAGRVPDPTRDGLPDFKACASLADGVKPAQALADVLNGQARPEVAMLRLAFQYGIEHAERARRHGLKP